MNAPLPKVDTWGLRQSLPDVGEGLAAQLAELSVRPTAERCERAAMNLDGARQSVMRLRERLLAGDEGDGQ